MTERDEIMNLEYALAKTESLLRTEKLKVKILLSALEKLSTSEQAQGWVRNDAARAMSDVAKL